MSWNPLLEPSYPDADSLDAIETLTVPRAVDLGGFEVRRVPAEQRQMVGPFIFFDHFGPVDVPAGKGADVRPHPHIGLATITYLLLGEVQHRDSVGSNQIIRPGDVNWMVAGRGITHSERTPAETRKRPHSGHGIQTWVALPKAHEDAAPKFEHHAKETLPVIESDDVRLRLVLGRAYGETAPASVFSDSFYAYVQLSPNARIPLPEAHEERGLYVLEGSVSVAGQFFVSVGCWCSGPKTASPSRRGPRARASSFSAARRSKGRATSGGILSPRTGRRSTPQRRNGARPTGAVACSIFHPEIATNSFRCRPKVDPFDASDSVDALAGV